MAWMKVTEGLAKLPPLLIHGKFSYDFDGVPLVAEQLSMKKRINLIRVGLDSMLRSSYAHGLPPIIHIEPTNVCNLRCPLCPSGLGLLKRPKGVMSMKTFVRILDELEDTLLAVYLFSFGEPFMNKDLPRMIEACTSRGILTLISTNGHFVQDMDEALRIVDAGLTTMVIAMDGSTQEIYEKYRMSGDIEKVKRCARLIEQAKALRNSKYPYTAIRAVVTRDNQDDLPNIKKLSRDLGVNMFTYKSLGLLVHSDKYKQYEPLGKDLRRFELRRSPGRSTEGFQCIFPFRQPWIFWDGTVVGCEYDHDLTLPFGKIGEQSFHEIWNSPNALRLRRNVREGRYESSFCSRCPFRNRVQKGSDLASYEFRRVHDLRVFTGGKEF